MKGKEKEREFSFWFLGFNRRKEEEKPEREEREESGRHGNHHHNRRPWTIPSIIPYDFPLVLNYLRIDVSFSYRIRLIASTDHWVETAAGRY